MRNGQQYSATWSCVFAGVVAVVVLGSLLGCSASFNRAPVAGAASVAGLHGSVHGGQPPLTGARIYLFAAGTTGYQSASTSLLISGVATDGSGNGYVTTDSTGSFSLTGDWTCPHATDQVYLLATGGNPGLAPGTNNTAIVMMDALGTCSTLNASTFIVVNELSTVAAATALHRFLKDGTHLGTSPGNTTGLANAFATVTNMVDIGATGARTTTPGGNGTVPQAKLHTLANILSSCVNSDSNTSSNCTALFSAATDITTPTDTLVAARNIASNALNPTGPLFALSPATPPFQPALASAPTDWTLSVTYTLGSGTPLPGYLAIDANGDVWISNLASEKTPAGTDSIIEVSPTGAILSGTGFTAGGVNLPEGLAIDDSGNVWVANTPGSVIRLNSAGALTTGFPVTIGNVPQGIALDTSGNAWVSNNGDGSVMQISPSGTTLQSGITSTGFTLPQGVALDTSGNVWVAGQGSNSILKLNSSGVVQSGSGTGYTGGGLNAPAGLQIDGSGNVWVANSTGGSAAPSISEFTSAGAAVTGTAGYGTGAVGYENILFIDGKGNVFSASCGPQCVGSGVDNVISLKPDGTTTTGTGGYQNPDFNAPQAIAVDASGNMWVGNTAGQANAVAGTLTEVIGVAHPVKTPLQAALKSGLLGQEP